MVSFESGMVESGMNWVEEADNNVQSVPTGLRRRSW